MINFGKNPPCLLQQITCVPWRRHPEIIQWKLQLWLSHLKWHIPILVKGNYPNVISIHIYIFQICYLYIYEYISIKCCEYAQFISVYINVFQFISVYIVILMAVIWIIYIYTPYIIYIYIHVYIPILILYIHTYVYIYTYVNK